MADDFTPAGNDWLRENPDGAVVHVVPTRIVDDDGNQVGVPFNPLRTLVCSGCSQTRQVVGRNPAVSTSLETVWSAGGLYPWSAWATPGVLAIVSDDALDVGVQVTLEGLDADGEPVTETLTTDGTDGTTPVTGEVTFGRINAAYVSNGVDMQAAATITVSRGGTTVAEIEAAYQAASLGVYSVPAGSTAEVLSVRWGTSKGDEVTAIVASRELDGVFVARDVTDVYDGPTAYEYGRHDVPGSGLLVGERADIELRGIQVTGSGTAVVSGGVVVVLRPVP